MTTLQMITISISIIALFISIGGFLSSRQATWSMRYHEHWFQLARFVLDHPDTFLPLWSSPRLYEQLFAKKLPPGKKPAARELVFVEMYVDFMIEVHRRGRLAAFLTGKYPGRVPLTNPRAIHIWEKYICASTLDCIPARRKEQCRHDIQQS